jgi:hypothetical protein
MSAVTEGHIERESLGLHFLGELDAATSAAIHRHLDDCESCRAVADEIVDALGMMALTLDLGAELPEGAELPGEAALSGEAGLADDAELADEDETHAVARASVTFRGKAARPVPPKPAPPAVSARPKDNRPRSRPGRRRRVRTMVAMLALVLVVGGLGFGALVRGRHDDGTSAVTAAATAGAAHNGAAVSIFVTAEGGDCLVRAGIDHLPPGDYVLYGVTAAGQTREITRWKSSGQAEQIEGRIAGLDVGELSFVTVTAATGAPVVTVNLSGTSGN